MKNTLYLKFIAAYILVGIIGLVTLSTFGSDMIQEQVTRYLGDSLYRESISIAAHESSGDYSQEKDVLETYKNLSILSDYQGARILILNRDGVPLLDTGLDYDSDRPFAALSRFDPAAIGNSHYKIGTFFGYFGENMLNTLVPITSDLSTKGYVSLHIPASEIISHREMILVPVYIVFLVLYVLFFSIFGLFSYSVYRPLKKIAYGANEYASGNLKYVIPVQKDDEIGYLASTLNYMSDELDKLGESQKQFIANVSHDFRSPLTSIKGYVEAIMDGTIPHEMQDRYLKIVVDETERLEKLTKSLLTLERLDSKGRPMNVTNFDINCTIKNTAATFEGTCRKKLITIELHLESEQLYVSADKEQIQQVLYNLIDNAIKFSPRDSIIKVDTSERHGTVFVSVKDSGVGIPKNSLNKVWDRFFKQDLSRGKDRKGTGLGLAIVKEIISAHNQNINVISTEGVGTEFIFTLEKAK